MGLLANVHTDRGLPRGRGSLPQDEVLAAQRRRILRAVTAAVAEQGYANVRIADIADRARTSKQSFYALFADKQECFLAAHAEGVAILVARLSAWALDDADPDPAAQVAGGVRAYLGMAFEEPEFARCMLVELQAIGPDGLAARIEVHQQIATLLRAWHRAASKRAHGWPRVPDSRYSAAVGAVHDLLFDAVASGLPADPTALGDAAVDAVLMLLEIPPGR
jgi:AcrR family transcriptional regulator